MTVAPKIEEEAFTKPGTANVSAGDLKKLGPLMRHYAKMPHPFTSCKRDQLKHGLTEDHANRRCAVLKDLIRGTTKWRNREEEDAARQAYEEARDRLLEIGEVVGHGLAMDLALAEEEPTLMPEAERELREELKNCEALLRYLQPTLSESRVWVPPYKRLGRSVDGYWRDLAGHINRGGDADLPGNVKVRRLSGAGGYRVSAPGKPDSHVIRRPADAAKAALNRSAETAAPESPGGSAKKSRSFAVALKADPRASRKHLKSNIPDPTKLPDARDEGKGFRAGPGGRAGTGRGGLSKPGSYSKKWKDRPSGQSPQADAADRRARQRKATGATPRGGPSKAEIDVRDAAAARRDATRAEREKGKRERRTGLGGVPEGKPIKAKIGKGRPVGSRAKREKSPAATVGRPAADVGKSRFGASDEQVKQGLERARKNRDLSDKALGRRFFSLRKGESVDLPNGVTVIRRSANTRGLEVTVKGKRVGPDRPLDPGEAGIWAGSTARGESSRARGGRAPKRDQPKPRTAPRSGSKPKTSRKAAAQNPDTVPESRLVDNPFPGGALSVVHLKGLKKGDRMKDKKTGVTVERVAGGKFKVVGKESAGTFTAAQVVKYAIVKGR